MSATGADVGRVARLVVFASSACGLSVIAHLGAGGSVPGPARGVVAGLVALWFAVPLLWRRPPTPALAAAAAGAQVVLHWVLSWGPTAAGCPAPAHTGHLGPGPAARATVAATSPCGSGTSGSLMTHDSVSMLLAHALVAAVLVLAVAHGQALLAALVRLLAPAGPVAQARAADPVRPAAIGSADRHPSLLLGVGGLGRRGPPPTTAGHGH